MDISSLRERTGASGFTVTELNNYIKNIFEADRTLSSVTVKGEISNFTAHRSGHLYFSLKDADSQIKAVMFRSSASRLRFMPENGMRVIVHGSVSCFSRDGVYQLYAGSIQPDGVGALYLAYEQLKERLAEEGLFDEGHKKPIPELPRNIGVITSPTGAAVRDIINIVKRRFPIATVYVYPALVQGEGAEASLIEGVDFFDNSKLVDTVIIGRGGGSIEDLWAFNSEALARRIFSAEVPVISAVGHETDFTICDFVSDLRAPTPSAAAELAVPDMRELIERIDVSLDRAERALTRRLERSAERLENLNQRLLASGVPQLLLQKRELVERLRVMADRGVSDVLSGLSSRLAVSSEKLVALNPLGVLSRGYSTVAVRGKVVGSVSELNDGDTITVRFSDGAADAVVNRISKEY